MGEKIFDLLKANIKNPKLYVVLFIFIMVTLILFPYIDANYFYYNRVEKRITILNKIAEIDENKIMDNKILKDEYQSILQEIDRQTDGSLSSVFITENSSNVNKNKFLSGALISWIIGLMCLFIKMKNKWYKLFGLCLFIIIGGILGYISMIIPTIISPICNYIFMPVIQCLVLGMLVTFGNKK